VANTNLVTGTLVGIVFIGLAVGGALAGNVYPMYATATTLIPIPLFVLFLPSLHLALVDQQILMSTSKTYYVGLQYYGPPNLGQVKTIVQNNKLIIDSSQFNWSRHCQIICILVL